MKQRKSHFFRGMMLFMVFLSMAWVNLDCGDNKPTEKTPETSQEITPDASADAAPKDSTKDDAPPQDRATPKDDTTPDEPLKEATQEVTSPDEPTAGDEPTNTEQPPTETPSETTSETTSETSPDQTKTATWTGSIGSFIDGSRLDGTKVCLQDPQGVPCVTTNAMGQYTLPGVPEQTRLLLSFEKTGYVRVVHGIDASATTRNASLSMLPSQAAPLFAQAVGATLKAGTGIVVLQAYDSTLRAFHSHLKIKMNAAGAQGPYYLSAQSQPDPTLTSTSSLGIAFYINVPVGTHTITTSGEGGTSCTATRAWAGQNPDEFEAKAEADSMTYLFVQCERKLNISGVVSNFATRGPLDGAKICLEEPKGTNTTCATSNATGDHVLQGVPDKPELLLSAEKTGFVKILQGFSKGQSSRFSPAMIPTSALPLLAGAVGLTLKAGTGIVVMTAIDRVSGAATDISMSISATGADGPYFINPTGVPDKSLTGTSAAGFAFFANVPPGDYVVTVKGNANQSCTAYRGWQGQKPEEIRVGVQADAATYFTVQCGRDRTRKLGESCKQADNTKPEYADCVTDHACVSGTCVASSKQFEACTNEKACVTGSRCIGTKTPARFCLASCDPAKPNCPSGFGCVNLNDNSGACFKICTATTDCTDYGTVCETSTGGATGIKYCK